ncbi:MAG: GAF domain-containing sensor histidine kinase [Planctomycetota bacterium]|jgi:signal transduction histidine kinase
MNAPAPHKLNCWEFRNCGRGPSSGDPCPAATETTCDGINDGTNGGRFCWAVAGSLSGHTDPAACATATDCLTCDFFHRVKSEEGQSFDLLKLALGARNAKQLRHTIGKVESLVAIHERLRSQFDLDATIQEITREARDVTGAQRSLVLLLRGKPLALHGEFFLRGKRRKVVIELDDSSAVGFACRRKQMVNLRDIYEESNQSGSVPVFNRGFDDQCRCRTRSFVAAPICDAEDRALGVVTAANAKKGYFSSDDEWFMEKYATEVALAVEKQKFIQQSVSALRLVSIGETVAGLSHCIKNIAQALRTGSHVIKRAIRSNNLQDVKTAWQLLDRHIERLADLSMDVLAYDPGVREHSAGGRLDNLVRHVVDLFREEARARAIELTFGGDENVSPAKFDPMGIYRCLVNLVSNALDACPLSAGVVTVATKRTKEDEFMISVADNGRGMDEETKATVFQLFRTTKKRTGTGLGLATVADIVDKHNGRIEIDSQPGMGTTVRIFIREDVGVA